MKNINVIVAAFFLMMLVGLLAGCGSSSTPENISGEAANTEQPSNDIDIEQPSEEPHDIDEDETQKKIEEELESQLALKRGVIIEQSQTLFKGYFYEEAIQLLNSDATLTNFETKQLEDEIVQAMDNLVLYEGTVRHIFFHSLILYPEYLFPDLKTPTGGYNEGFAFKSELERLLPQLLERGYVLYNINDVFSTDENGVMIKNDIYLPPGKMPLILSIDDPTYHYGIGFANRMILDETGALATEVITPSNEKIVTYDGDVELVVNNFVREHPEFSYRGHKGIIAATGYMGIFGYDLETEQSKQDAIAVCNKLKDSGWIFASHSYTHNRNGYWGPNSSAAKISYDTKRWKETIAPITGSTNIFIAPFGYTLKGEAMNVIINNGFDIYCSVVSEQKMSVNERYALMGRLEIGGYSLVRYTDILNRDFFDAATVKDAHRPPILSN